MAGHPHTRYIRLLANNLDPGVNVAGNPRIGFPSLAAIEIKDFRQDFGRALAFNLGGASILIGRR